MTTLIWRDWSCTVRLVIGQDIEVSTLLAREATQIVRILMADVDRAVSRFRSDSELELVNDHAPRVLPVGPLTLTLVEAALAAARRTDGAVDPTVGDQVRALGYDDDLATVAARTSVIRGVPSADWTRVVADHDLGLVGVARGLRLDLGATAKAWTADEAARRVAARTRLPALVEIGGDLAVAGPASAPWRVRVSESESSPGQVVGLTYGGLATSSTTVRSWRTDHGPAHHVVDPKTGRPVAGSVRTATVWAPSALDANTFSTAALVWGSAAPARLALAGVEARLVDRSGVAQLVGAWPEGELAA